MSMIGKTICNTIYNSIINEISLLKTKNIIPALAIILIGDNKASEIYVNMKNKKCIQLGIQSFIYKFDKKEKEFNILNKIKNLNHNNNIHGILVQLPIPKHLSTYNILNEINTNKDVDGLNNTNISNIYLNRKPDFYPCTPLGCIELLKYYKIDIKSKNAVIIGDSQIVGKPLAMMLNNLGATVTICNINTKSLKQHTLIADIILTGTGVINLITKDMVNQDSIIIDIGINKIKNNDGKDIVVGDCDYDNLHKYVKLITPVPGGIGPMTICMLMRQTVSSALKTI